MKKIVIMLVLCGAVFACYSQEIYSKINSRNLLRIMRDEGYSASLDKDADILWKKDGVSSSIIFSNGNKEETSFYFCLSYQVKQEKMEMALALSNEYNKTHKFGKSYVSKDSIRFNLPLSLRNGVTKGRIIDFLDDCQTFARSWEKEVVEKL